MNRFILLIIVVVVVGSYVVKYQPVSYVVSVGSQQFVVRIGHEQERQAGQEQPVVAVPPTAYAPQTDEERWAYDMLTQLGNPAPSFESVQHVVAWQRGESTAAANNPLATTQGWEGDSCYNYLSGRCGVRNYRTREDGLAATIRTLTNGYYPSIYQGLVTNNPEMALNADELGTWGTGLANVETGYRALVQNAPAAPTAQPAPQQPTQAAEDVRHQIIQTALSQLGKPYILGTEGPDTFDCSGLVQWTYAQYGIKTTRTTFTQLDALRPIDPSQVQTGDMVYFQYPWDQSFEDVANRTPSKFSHWSWWCVSAQRTISTLYMMLDDFTIEYVNHIGCGLIDTLGTPASSAVGKLVIDNCIFYGAYTGFNSYSVGSPTIWLTNNVFDNFNIGSLQGVACKVVNNKFFSGSTSSYLFQMGYFFNPVEWSGNSWDLQTLGVNFAIGGASAPTIGLFMSNDRFGQDAANTNSFAFAINSLVQAECYSPTGTPVISLTNIKGTINGSYLKLTDVNDTANDDRGYYTYGQIWRSGSGLTKTTVRTSGTGKYAVCFMPNDGTNLLKWTQNVPTGSIQNKTMTVSAWVNIANSAYAAGTHTKPQLSVNYDNGTVATATATATYGSWQQLAVTFTPTSTYGQITVTIQGATDATGANAEFYADDINIAYPAGVQVDLGGLDLWANGLPITPAIATFPSLGGVWDEALSAHTVSGSFGAFVKKLLTVAKFVGLK